MSLRVVKFGGSLLDMPEVAEQLRRWLARQAEMETLLVVGGGQLADAIRESQARHRFTDRTAHWLCVRAMVIQAEIMQTLLPEAGALAAVHEMGVSPDRLRILDPWTFMRHEEPGGRGNRLPESWDVTSDSIAARAAQLLCADELVLLKSALSAQVTIDEMSRNAYVDRFFPIAAGAIERVRFVHLRDANFAEIAIQRGGGSC